MNITNLQGMKRLVFLFVLISTACSVTKTTSPTHPFSGDEIGCSRFIVYKFSEDNKEFISISLKTSEIEIQGTQLYGVGKNDVLEVKKKRYAESIDEFLCNDIMGEKPELLSETLATEGVAEVRLSDQELEKYRNNEPYKVTIILKNVTFSDTLIDYLQIENVRVGWLPG
ncbi:MAG: hypothetical protein HRT61_15240 [Ekhidna sp.]|nr:hypothetical protein [Ekhidna sp.]